jgi:mono/diheme cytochrome c family protein
MKKFSLVLILIVFYSFASNITAAIATSKDTGEALFKKHCSVCHPHVANLRPLSLKKILDTIKNPSPYMPNFDENKISDDDAKRIADYIRQGP